MRLRYVSDLHLEFSNFTMYLDYHGEDVLVLAGDVTVKNNDDWVLEQANKFPHVVYVMGNHEYYGRRIDKVERKFREKADAYPNFHFLQNESVTLDGVTFHGATLWTDMNKGDPLTVSEVGMRMNDYRQIQYKHNGNYYKFGPKDAMREHMVSKQYLMDNVKEGDVVVTHMAPTYLSIHDDYKHDLRMNGGYASDLSDLMLDNAPSLWFHGHVHNTFDYMVGDTRVLCNPRGYEGHELNPDFDPNRTVSIPNA